MVRGPGQRNLDLAIERTIPIGESHNFLARVELFNLANTPNFGNPNNTVGTPGFGVISTTVNNPRVIQLVLKYQF
jgi:hypothetical protein